MEDKYRDSVREYHFSNRRPQHRKGRSNKNKIIPIIIIILLLIIVIIGAILLAKVISSDDNPAPVSSISSESSVQSDGTAGGAQSGTDGTSSVADNTSTTAPSSTPESSNADGIDSRYAVGESDEPWNEWYLKIVSVKSPLEDGFDPPLSTITQTYAAYSNMKFDSRAIGALEDMIEAAAEDGVTLTVISSYRTVQRQQELFDDKVRRVLLENPSLSREEAEEKAATEVTRPGTGEHHTGLAVDFNLAESWFEGTVQDKWLKANAEKYGFVNRYPKDKQDITGIIPEAWHYRFVGAEHAKRMNELNMCLEEYVDYLKEGNK